jgi:hypothetical protein
MLYAHRRTNGSLRSALMNLSNLHI